MKFGTREHLHAAKGMPGKRSPALKKERKKIASYFKLRRSVDGPNAAKRDHVHGRVKSGSEATRRAKQLTPSTGVHAKAPTWFKYNR
jgi:hypothetical protein